MYKYEVAELLNRRPGQIVLDVGGGKECPFLAFVDPPCGHLIMALDLSDEELRQTVSSITRSLPTRRRSGFHFATLRPISSCPRAVVEHIRDNAAFFRNCARVLRPSGIVAHAFSGRFAPFALMNQLLPNRLTRRVIDYLHPEWHEEGNYGFLAFYDRCYFSTV